MSGQGRGRSWNRREVPNFRGNAGGYEHGGNKQRPTYGNNQDTRGSRSMSDLSANFAQMNNTGRKSFRGQTFYGSDMRGRGYRGGMRDRGGQNNAFNQNCFENRNRRCQEFMPPPSQGRYPQYSEPNCPDWNIYNADMNPPYNHNFPPHPQPDFQQGYPDRGTNMHFPQHDRYGMKGRGRGGQNTFCDQNRFRDNNKGWMESMPPSPHPRDFNVNPPFNPDYPPPPPSYDESLEDYQVPLNRNPSNNSPSGKKDLQPKLTVEALVKSLAIFSRQFATPETIGRQVEVHPSAVVNVAESRKDLFVIASLGNTTEIKLVPKLALCLNYLSPGGCSSKDSCVKLHICKSYATDYCNERSSCQYGHRWDTSHNNTILSKFYLDCIDIKTLHQIVKRVCKDNSKLEICNFYNIEGRGCRYGERCGMLHICKSYVLGVGRCSNKDCSLNHDILAQQCTKLLKCFRVPVNESPRDILMQLAEAVKKDSGQHLASFSGDENTTKRKGKTEKIIRGKKDNEKIKNIKKHENKSSDSESSDNTLDENQHKNLEDKNKRQIGKIRNKTYKSTDVHGDVETPGICVNSIDDKCKNEKNGCKYLHAKSLFHWQFERTGKWYNFRIFQSKILENAYRDVAKCSIQVPSLEESKLEDHTKELLNVLGTDSWKADFRAMDMTSNNISLKIRRVSTQSSVIFSSPKATVYEWYFEDDQGKWIQYGQVDSLGKQQLVCNISSEDIEKQYLSDPSSSMLICNAHYKYKLNFSKMTQVNEQTGKEREVRRRPSRLSYQKKPPAEKNPSSAVPVHWNQMTEGQTHLLVPLDPSSAEYQEVSSRLRNSLPTAIIQKIQRLQNPYLWRLLQYRKAELSQRYDDYQLNMQKLFYGINPQDIDSICKENIDWRQNDTAEQSYGQGTYFSISAAIARGHCIPDEFNKVFVFLVDVIIGMVVKGDKSLTRPPHNPITNALYDTTVNDITAPTVFVKYDKQEYYPEYVIEFY